MMPRTDSAAPDPSAESIFTSGAFVVPMRDIYAYDPQGRAYEAHAPRLPSAGPDDLFRKWRDRYPDADIEVDNVVASECAWDGSAEASEPEWAVTRFSGLVFARRAFAAPAFRNL